MSAAAARELTRWMGSAAGQGYVHSMVSILDDLLKMSKHCRERYVYHHGVNAGAGALGAIAGGIGIAAAAAALAVSTGGLAAPVAVGLMTAGVATGATSAVVGLGNLAVQLGLDSRQSAAFEDKMKELDGPAQEYERRWKRLLDAVTEETAAGDDVDHYLATVLGHLQSVGSNGYTLGGAGVSIAVNVRLLKSISEVEVFNGARIVVQEVGNAGRVATGLGVAFGAVGLVLGISQMISAASNAKAGSSSCADIMDYQADKLSQQLHFLLSICRGTPAQRQLAPRLPVLVMVDFTELVTPIPNYRFGDLTRNLWRKMKGDLPEEVDAYFTCALPKSGRRYESTLVQVIPGQAGTFTRTVVFRQEGETECYIQPFGKRAAVHEATAGNSSLSVSHKATADEHWNGQVLLFSGGVCRYQTIFGGETSYFKASISIMRAV